MIELKIGMIDKQIYDILDGNVSGEGTEQIQEFFSCRELVHKDKPDVLHEVIKANDKYAVIERKKSFFSTPAVFLSGINDEGKYFIKQIQNHLLTDIEVDAILDDINRVSEGYERVQGDLLVKALPLTLATGMIMTRKIKHNILIKTLYSIEKTLYPTYFKFYVDGVNRPPNWFAPLKRINDYADAVQNIGTNMMFGNHKVVVENGEAYANYTQRLVIVIGNKVTIYHQEHKTTELVIPKQMCLMFTVQKSIRGND